MEPAATPAEALAIAQEGYIFGLPLVYIALQADAQSNVAHPVAGGAPFNQFDHHREFPDAANNKIVGMNVDTLYSLANIDVAAEPIVLAVPPMSDRRWWIMQVIDAWNDVPAAPGARTHGNRGGAFALVGPNYRGTAPPGLDTIQVDTSLIALGGRTYTRGKDDYAAVHQIQDGYQLIPLSQWKGTGTRYAPPTSVPVKQGVDRTTPVPRQVFALSAERYFGRLAELLVNNPPRDADAPLMQRLARLGVVPGAKVATTNLSPEVRQAIDEGVARAQKAIREQEANMGEMINGWQVARDLGRYGTKYLYRAAWTFFAVGGNLVEDAIYPVTLVDSDGMKLDGANRYTLTFAKEQIPPVEAFWSLTLYDKDSYLVVNPIDRYAVGDRSGMRSGKDGSLTIYIQAEAPDKDKAPTWLPSPKAGNFKLALRLYVPKQSVADGSWKPPAVHREEVVSAFRQKSA